MVKHRILEYVDDNGDVHYKCQWKGWIFWHYYKRGNLHYSAPEEFDSIFGIVKRIKKERRYKKKFVRSYPFAEQKDSGKSCSIDTMDKIKEGLHQP